MRCVNGDKLKKTLQFRTRMPKIQKPEKDVETLPEPLSSMGVAPAVLAKREKRIKAWCPTVDIEFEALCDSENPKAITYKDIQKAAAMVKLEIPMTPLMKSRDSKKFSMNLYFKVDSYYRTGSFNERRAFYALEKLNAEQKCAGVITASLGDWALALAYYGKQMGIKVTVVLPVATFLKIITKLKELKASVVLHGDTLADAKRHAFVMIAEYPFPPPPVYINGYDHPHVIAASGTIGLEIMEQLPETDVILVPVGGGALLAGIAVAAKQLKPEVLIYGIEPEKCCSFFKAMERGGPYKTAVMKGLAALAVPTVGFNSFHTAKSLISKMVLVDDDWIARAILHLTEEERIVADGAGATSLSALMALPDILTELKDKTVVCVVTGSNIDAVTLPRCMERAKAIDGRLIKLTVSLPADQLNVQLRVLSMVANVGGNVLHFDTEHNWLEEDDLFSVRLNLIIETRGIEHACTLKRVMNQIFPDICNFLEEPFSPIPICVCYPKKRVY